MARPLKNKFIIEVTLSVSVVYAKFSLKTIYIHSKFH